MISAAVVASTTASYICRRAVPWPGARTAPAPAGPMYAATKTSVAIMDTSTPRYLILSLLEHGECCLQRMTDNRDRARVRNRCVERRVTLMIDQVLKGRRYSRRRHGEPEVTASSCKTRRPQPPRRERTDPCDGGEERPSVSRPPRDRPARAAPARA